MITLFFTIFSSLLIFVLGQYFLKLIFEPIIAFKESLGALSAFCLMNRAIITNAHASLEHQKELLQLTSIILSKKEAILGYSILARSKCFNIPSERNILNACQKLNLVTGGMCPNTDSNKRTTVSCTRVFSELHDVSKLLNIRLDFE